MRRSLCPIGSGSTRNARRASPSAAAARPFSLPTMCWNSRRSIPGRLVRPIPRSDRKISPTTARSSGGRGFPAQRQGAFRLRAGTRPQTRSPTSAPMSPWPPRPGLTNEQIVRIYSFESGGTGKYDVQAGLEEPQSRAQGDFDRAWLQSIADREHREPAGRKGRAISSRPLQVRAAQLSAGGEDEARAQDRGCSKRMVAHSRTVPVQWSEHVKLGRTPKGLGLARAQSRHRHRAAAADPEAARFGACSRRRKGIDHTLTAAELEMMNLTGDGNGYRHGVDAAGDAVAGADLEFLPAPRL